MTKNYEPIEGLYLEHLGAPYCISHQRRGYAALVLGELEHLMVSEHDCKTGLLQAREHAIPFYKSQGWRLIDEPYSIGMIGPHRSMMKEFWVCRVYIPSLTYLCNGSFHERPLIVKKHTEDGIKRWICARKREQRWDWHNTLRQKNIKAPRRPLVTWTILVPREATRNQSLILIIMWPQINKSHESLYRLSLPICDRMHS